VGRVREGREMRCVVRRQEGGEHGRGGIGHRLEGGHALARADGQRADEGDDGRGDGGRRLRRRILRAGRRRGHRAREWAGCRQRVIAGRFCPAATTTVLVWSDPGAPVGRDRGCPGDASGADQDDAASVATAACVGDRARVVPRSGAAALPAPRGGPVGVRACAWPPGGAVRCWALGVVPLELGGGVGSLGRAGG